MKNSKLISIAVAIGLPLYFITCHFAENNSPLWYIGTAVALLFFFYGIINTAKEIRQKFC